MISPPFASSGGQANGSPIGFQVVRVDRFGLKDDRIPGKPSAMIKDLSELAALL